MLLQNGRGTGTSLDHRCYAGPEPYLFMHVPSDFHAPRLARRFFEQLAARVDVGTLPSWPGEHRQPSQVGLFSDESD